MARITRQITRRAFDRSNVQRSDRRPSMKQVKDTQHTMIEMSATRDELKLACQRIADMDALWRSSAYPDWLTEKRAA